jgi:hypothetical protein
MRIERLVLAAIACCGWFLVGCKGRETAAPAAQQAPSPPSIIEPAVVVADVTATAVEATSTPIPQAPTPAAVRRAAPTVIAGAARKTVAEPTRAMATPPAPAPPTSAPVSPTQVPRASRVDDPGGPIAVAATKPGLTRIGAEKCKVCHKIQFASWLETGHARRSPKLDCEGCHGPGSEYKAMAAMKDPQKAKAAGLVMPGATFCKTCHKRDWTDDMLRKAHAHKPS